jgi:hypothetical protein
MLLPGGGDAPPTRLRAACGCVRKCVGAFPTHLGCRCALTVVQGRGVPTCHTAIRRVRGGTPGNTALVQRAGHAARRPGAVQHHGNGLQGAVWRRACGLVVLLCGRVRADRVVVCTQGVCLCSRPSVRLGLRVCPAGARVGSRGNCSQCVLACADSLWPVCISVCVRVHECACTCRSVRECCSARIPVVVRRSSQRCVPRLNVTGTWCQHFPGVSCGREPTVVQGSHRDGGG